MIIIDAHEDLAYNILTFGRDYVRSALTTRELEAGTQTPQRNGDSLLGWPEYQKGQVAVVFGTLFVSPGHRQSEPWETQVYHDTSEANSLYRGQVDAYHRLADENPDKFRMVLRHSDLQEVLMPGKAQQKACPRKHRDPWQKLKAKRSPNRVIQWGW